MRKVSRIPPDWFFSDNCALTRASRGQGAIITRLMTAFELTSEQRAAVTACGHSVIVTAAAGSGKTAVLAERCAYLVCDAPLALRCDVDDLLVLTFTEAAAAEMRSRIVDAIRRRSQAEPGDLRLREQVTLADAAQISTIHSFCHRLIRRWFNEVDLDPTFSLLDAEEAALLERDVLDALFTRLYSAIDTSADPLGSPEHCDAKDAVSPAAVGDDLARGFVSLVDVYGLTNDRAVAALVLDLHEFVGSLPDPEDWLHKAAELVDEQAPELVLTLFGRLPPELERQADRCTQLALELEAGNPIGHSYAGKIRAYIGALESWKEGLPSDLPAGFGAGIPPRSVAELLVECDAVRQQIAEFEFPSDRAPRLSKDCEPAVRQARDAASELFRTQVKGRMFEDRLRRWFGLLSIDQHCAGLARVSPFVSTITRLVSAFRADYSAAKRRMDVLDFSDLERFALDLLHVDGDICRPSEAARALHRRFKHLLVDEFQDVNRIQEAIVRLVSREADPDLPDNLFVVGDVKQSIYRFRLAEPSVFNERLNRFRREKNEGRAIALQANFRSRPEILETVNTVFRQLMPIGGGDVVYDEEAHLRSGRPASSLDDTQPVELHLLERRIGASESLDDGDHSLEEDNADIGDPARWAPIEREAFLIGSLIREWIADATSEPKAPPRRYRDVAVLLRATAVNAERMAAVLSASGVPAYAEAGGSLLGALEVRDILAVLEVLDNLQQDIPLAAVLRNGVLGDPLSEDDLVEIRCANRAESFHVGVRAYASQGGVAEPVADPSLAGRLQTLLRRISSYREEARRRPVADVLWRLFHEHGYLAYVGGLPNGAQRRANLLKLHEMARKFGSFRRQGLHRFLSFVRSMTAENRQIPTASAIGESDDVVRIMSIHQSKGLEFPVVFVAGLGTRFNLRDRSGRMIFERRAYLGLRAVDTDRMIEYPTAAHILAAMEIERHAREEELRVLYVAMTRAREKLVLVGSTEGAARLERQVGAGAVGSSVSLHGVVTATTPLDWLIPALASAPDGMVRTSENRHARQPLVEVRAVDAAEIAGWGISRPAAVYSSALGDAVAKGAALPGDEPFDPAERAVEETLARIDYVYPHLAAGTVRAAVGASEFKGAYDFTADAEQRPESTGTDVSTLFTRQDVPGGGREEAVRRGIVTHRVLQHLDFTVSGDRARVASELQRLEVAGLLSGDDRSLVDEEGIAWLLQTPLADAIRAAGDAFRREFQYIASESPEWFDRSVDPGPGDFILVRGIADGVFPFANGIGIVDYKTDRVRPKDVPRRVEVYRPQMQLYSRAMSRIWRKPVSVCWLAFVAARELVELRDPTGSATSSPADWNSGLS